MSNVDAAIVFLPRFTTLVGGTGVSTFTTHPLDVSRYGSAQFQLWVSGTVVDPAVLRVYLEESLD